MTSMLCAQVDEQVKLRYRAFLESCRTADGQFRLTPRAEPGAYALCFAIFGLQLLHDARTLAENRSTWDETLRRNLRAMHEYRGRQAPLHRDKPYLQLLTFTLSALAILGTLRADPLRDRILEVVPRDLEAELATAGALDGRPRSGNQAMFLGIILLFARDVLGLNTQSLIDRWIELHLESVNRFGFWGASSSMSHLQFQNGYHQYELFEHLRIGRVPWNLAADSVAGIADHEGHFAPYPGGGGCYDYDAVFILTGGGPKTPESHRELLLTTFRTLQAVQNQDGGFGESRCVRPRSVTNLRRTVAHIASGHGKARWERLRQGLTLLRPRHDRIHTHWSRYSRDWSESNLWDSWFRMLTLARIEVAFDASRFENWGFIDFPGIGSHYLAKGDADSR